MKYSLARGLRIESIGRRKEYAKSKIKSTSSRIEPTGYSQ